MSSAASTSSISMPTHPLIGQRGSDLGPAPSWSRAGKRLVTAAVFFGVSAVCLASTVYGVCGGDNDVKNADGDIGNMDNVDAFDEVRHWDLNKTGCKLSHTCSSGKHCPSPRYCTYGACADLDDHYHDGRMNTPNKEIRDACSDVVSVARHQPQEEDSTVEQCSNLPAARDATIAVASAFAGSRFLYLFFWDVYHLCRDDHSNVRDDQVAMGLSEHSFVL